MTLSLTLFPVIFFDEDSESPLDDFEILARAGVYSIKCLVNQFTYYGSTSRSLNARLKEHLEGLRNGTHEIRRLQRDWKLYEEEDFVFKVMAVCHPKDCLTVEQLFLDEFGVGPKNSSYNTMPVAGSPLGVKRSEATKQKMRELRLGNPLSDAARLKMSKEYIITTPEGKELRVFNLKRFCDERGLSQSAMHSTMTGRVSHYKGWHCRYAEAELSEDEGSRTMVVYQNGRHQFRQLKTYEVINTEQAITLVVVNLQQFCDQNNLSASAMLKVAKGKQAAHKGWSCKEVLKD